MADDLRRPVDEPGQLTVPPRPGGRVEASDSTVIAELQLGQGGQRRFGGDKSRERAPAHHAGQVGQHLAVPRVDTEDPRGSLEADGLQVPQDGVHRRGVRPYRAADGPADADDTVGHVAADKGDLGSLGVIGEVRERGQRGPPGGDCGGLRGRGYRGFREGGHGERWGGGHGERWGGDGSSGRGARYAAYAAVPVELPGVLDPQGPAALLQRGTTDLKCPAAVHEVAGLLPQRLRQAPDELNAGAGRLDLVPGCACSARGTGTISAIGASGAARTRADRAQANGAWANGVTLAIGRAGMDLSDGEHEPARSADRAVMTR